MCVFDGDFSVQFLDKLFGNRTSKNFQIFFTHGE